MVALCIVLGIALVIKEIQYERVVQRMMLQANIPQTLSPVRAKAPPAETPEANPRKKLFSVQIPS